MSSGGREWLGRAALLVALFAASYAVFGREDGDRDDLDARAEETAARLVRALIVNHDPATADQYVARGSAIEPAAIAAFFGRHRWRAGTPTIAQDCRERVAGGPYPSGDCVVVPIRATAPPLAPALPKQELRQDVYVWLRRDDGRWRADVLASSGGFGVPGR